MPGVVKLINGLWLLVNGNLANAEGCCCAGACCTIDGNCVTEATDKAACEECIPIGTCTEYADEVEGGGCPAGFDYVPFVGCQRISTDVTEAECAAVDPPATWSTWIQTGTQGPCGNWTLTRACCAGICCQPSENCCGGICCPAGACNNGVCDPCDCQNVTYSEDTGDPLGQPTCQATECYTESIAIPFGCGQDGVYVTITGSVDDELLINGSVVQAGAYGSPCNPSHTVNYTFFTTTGFTVGFADNFYVLCGGDITICFSAEPPPP